MAQRRAVRMSSLCRAPPWRLRVLPPARSRRRRSWARPWRRSFRARLVAQPHRLPSSSRAAP
eukprot:14653687-Alexandrium_andersonii.AAC.1